MDQILSTLRLTWQWRRLFARALVLPLLGMAAFMVFDWTSPVLIDLTIALGSLLLSDSESALAYTIVRSAYGTLYSACIAIATATIVNTITTGPAAAARWLPPERTVPFIAALAVANFAATLVIFGGQQMVRGAIASSISSSINDDASMLAALDQALDTIEFAAPVVTVVAIHAARRVFIAAAATTMPPQIAHFLNAAVIAIVAATATEVVATALRTQLSLEGQLPLVDTVIGLATYLALDSVWIAVFATTIAVAAFGRPRAARSHVNS